MLYSEFVQGTGCRETDNNYSVYKELELIYMNSDCTKEHIYEMGKKLVDNSKTKEEIALENQYKEEIESLKRDIEIHKDFVKYYTTMNDKRMAKYHKDEAKACRARIKENKWLMGL